MSDTLSYSDLNLETCIKDLPEKLIKNVSEKVFESLSCTICQELMYSPFITTCGHSFCYGCLNEWFKNQLSCPVCRSKIKQSPVINHGLKDIVHIYLDSIISNDSDPESTREKISQFRQSKDAEFLTDVTIKKHPFGGRFKNSVTALVDRSDGVPRCGNCFWEIHDSVCSNCGTEAIDMFSYYEDGDDGGSLQSSDGSGEMYYIRRELERQAVEDEQEEEEEEEEEDSDDSFIDRRPLIDILNESSMDDTDDILHSSDEDNSEEDDIHVQQDSHSHVSSSDDEEYDNVVPRAISRRRPRTRRIESDSESDQDGVVLSPTLDTGSSVNNSARLRGDSEEDVCYSNNDGSDSGSDDANSGSGYDDGDPEVETDDSDDSRFMEFGYRDNPGPFVEFPFRNYTLSVQIHAFKELSDLEFEALRRFSTEEYNNMLHMRRRRLAMEGVFGSRVDMSHILRIEEEQEEIHRLVQDEFRNRQDISTRSPAIPDFSFGDPDPELRDSSRPPSRGNDNRNRIETRRTMREMIRRIRSRNTRRPMR